jgi:hypothetical protein
MCFLGHSGRGFLPDAGTPYTTALTTALGVDEVGAVNSVKGLKRISAICERRISRHLRPLDQAEPASSD